MKPRLACLFHELENIHLTKDVGMIPYILQNEYGYDCTMVCYGKGEYPYLKTEVKGLKIDFIARKTGNHNLDTYLYLIKNRNKYDILQVYHPTIYNVIFLLFFKWINFYRKIKTHLKLDVDEAIFTVNGYSKFKQYIYCFFLRYVDVVSVETTILYKKLIKFKPYRKNLIYLPNGYYPKQNYNFGEKQNTIICVGVVGAPRKDNKTLMEAFVRFYEINKSWNLKFIGPIVNNFENQINAYFKTNPELKNSVIFTGNISDKKILLDEYQQAKMLILTSKTESFGMVFTEAMNSGCHIITSNVISANDITDNGKTGIIFPIGDVEALVKAMVKMDEKLKNLTNSQIEEYNKVRDNFYWKDILKLLHDKL